MFRNSPRYRNAFGVLVLWAWIALEMAPERGQGHTSRVGTPTGKACRFLPHLRW